MGGRQAILASTRPVPASARRVISGITAKMSPSPIEGGYVIGGKYQLVRLLGRGSMGEVWIAHHRTLGEDVAIKLLAPADAVSEVESYPTASARFRFEAQVAARLSRKTRHIVRVTDHGEEEGDAPAYLVMELLAGHTLERRLAMYGDMPPDEVFRLVAQIARALEYAHAESVVHRDLKPANIFLARDEDGGVLVKLLDFGIARATRTQRMPSPFSTGEGIVFGTPGYMSPEQACGSRLDGRVDLWALATVAYEALTGELPLRGTYTHELLRSLHLGELVPIHERNPELPAGLAGFFRRAFDPRIEHRFASASELASSFAQAIATGRRAGTDGADARPSRAPGRYAADGGRVTAGSEAPFTTAATGVAAARLRGSAVALVAIVATRMNSGRRRSVALPLRRRARSRRPRPSPFALVPESPSWPTRLRPRRRSCRRSRNRLAIPTQVVPPGRLPDPLRRSRPRRPPPRRPRSRRRPLRPYRCPLLRSRPQAGAPVDRSATL